ncbi:hypothetical protein CK203_017268 [Vitis vinifera]|uniref:RRM domain-containing protein n=1 Tax=Vitis vinifera TaxID=29760 RepID=A0A438JZG9_VITVI|nr:hypothetical protein CK203_017268 [Vitis vinifera]
MSLHSSAFIPSICLKYPLYPLPLLYTNPTTKFSFELCSSVQEIEVEAKPEQTQEPNQKRKLFVLNLPWSLSVVDIKNLFGECGTVTDVEIIKQKDGGAGVMPLLPWILEKKLRQLSRNLTLM